MWGKALNFAYRCPVHAVGANDSPRVWWGYCALGAPRNAAKWNLGKRLLTREGSGFVNARICALQEQWTGVGTYLNAKTCKRVKVQVRIKLQCNKSNAESNASLRTSVQCHYNPRLHQANNFSKVCSHQGAKNNCFLVCKIFCCV